MIYTTVIVQHRLPAHWDPKYGTSICLPAGSLTIYIL